MDDFLCERPPAKSASGQKYVSPGSLSPAIVLDPAYFSRNCTDRHLCPRWRAETFYSLSVSAAPAQQLRQLGEVCPHAAGLVLNGRAPRTVNAD